MSLEVVRERVGGIWRTVVRPGSQGGGSQPFTGWTGDGGDPASVDSNGADLTVSTLNATHLTGDLVTNGGDVETGGGALTLDGGAVDMGGGAISNAYSLSLDGNGGTLDSNGGDVLLGGARLITGGGAIIGADGGGGNVTLGASGDGLGFFGGVPAGQPQVPASPTAQDVVDALVALCLVTQAS